MKTAILFAATAGEKRPHHDEHPQPNFWMLLATCRICFLRWARALVLSGRKFALGIKEVAIIVISGLSDVEERALGLADKKIRANAGPNREILAAELGELAYLLPESSLDIEIFEPAEIEAAAARSSAKRARAK